MAGAEAMRRAIEKINLVMKTRPLICSLALDHSSNQGRALVGHAAASKRQSADLANRHIVELRTGLKAADRGCG
jgi:hypothetical protein